MFYILLPGNNNLARRLLENRSSSFSSSPCAHTNLQTHCSSQYTMQKSANNSLTSFSPIPTFGVIFLSIGFQHHHAIEASKSK